MTKEEIKKVLALCIDTFNDVHDSCDICEYSDYNNCQDYLCRDALAIINEQEKEIEKQNSRVKVLKERLNRKYAHISNAETEYEKAFELLKAQRKEIDILKENLKNLKDDFDSLQKDYEFVRDCDAEHCIEIEETVKQAKIDVLNKLRKKKSITIRDIDEIIEELQK